MRAALMHEFNKPLSVEDVKVEEPRAGEVLVRIAASGICGSDIHALQGLSSVTRTFPIILGHEGAGRIEAVGPGVTAVQPGDHVVIAMFGPCGACPNCRAGKLQYCSGPERRSTYGEMVDGSTRLSQPGKPVYPFLGIGSVGEYAVVRAAMVVKVSRDIPFERLCITACGVTTGIGAVFNVAQVFPGASVLVVGCGGVGLNVIQGARIAGASTIIAVDKNPKKLDMAMNFGASHCVLATEEPASLDEAVKAIAPRGVNFAFDVVGNTSIVEQLIGLTGSAGMTLMVGVPPWTSRVSVQPSLMLYGERKLAGVAAGSNIPGREIPRILDLYQQKRLKLDELVGHIYDLDDINAAFAAAEKADDARTVVRMSRELT